MGPPGTLQDPTETLLCDRKEHGPVLGNQPLKRGQPVWGCDFESRMCQPMGAPLSEEGSEHLDCSPPTDFSQPESGSYVQPLCSFSLLG